MRLFIARIQGFIKYKDLMGQLISRDLKLKYRRSVLGYLWSILNPLFIMVIMAIVFSHMFHQKNIPNYPVYLMSGQVLFNFMNISTHQALGAITGNAALLKKTYLPKYVFTVSKITSSFVNMIFALGALIIVFIVCRVVPNVFFLFIPVILLQEYLFCLGLGMLLAQGCVFFRDIEYLWSVMLMLIMYCSAIFYFASNMSGDTQKLVKLNPLFGVIDNFRRAFFGQPFDMRLLLYTSVFAVGTLVIGMIVFYRKQDSFILNI